MKIPAKGFTHGGKFHADDVFSTALLQIVRPDIEISRGFTVPEGFSGIVFDIGGGMFDHHSEPRETRPNGVPYAAFGLLWRVLGPQLVGAHQARLVDENFIQPLDLNDNTGEPNSLAEAIGSFNPRWDSKDDPDACFWRAVGLRGRSWTTRSRPQTPSTALTKQSSAPTATQRTALWCCRPICPGKTGCTRPTPSLSYTQASAAVSAPSA